MTIKETYEELKALFPNKFISVSYNMHRYSSNSEETECTVYMEDTQSFAAPTFALALDKLKAEMGLIEPDELVLED